MKWLFDACPDSRSNSMILWILGDNLAGDGNGHNNPGHINQNGSRLGIQRIADDSFSPCFYVHHPSLSELSLLAKALETLDIVADTELVKKKTDIRATCPETVLAVYPRGYSDMKECARIIDSRGGYREYRLFNVDLRLSQRYLIERGLFPLARLEETGIECSSRVCDTGTFPRTEEDQFSSAYGIPSMVSAVMSVKMASNIPNFDKPITEACLGEVGIAGGTGEETYGSHRIMDDQVLHGDEKEILLSLVGSLRAIDPDIIYTSDGDNFVVPYVYHRADVCGLGDEFYLGRELQGRNTGRKGRSYFSYGNILYKPPSYTLNGRWHIDRNSFIWSEGGLYGLVDLSRLSNIPVQTMSRLSPGTSISAMQVQWALRHGHAVMWKKNMPEDFKTAAELLIADRGGMILDPKVGIHSGVIETDFVSLYPNIMAKYNISPETISCRCCPDSRMIVPELGYRTCEKSVGMIPQVVTPLVQRRMELKRLIREYPTRKEEYSGRASLLKWVLVTCFGYTGYRNSRYGRIECHESINAYGRELMIRTVRLAEETGYEVLHGIIDSLWLKPRFAGIDHDCFCRRVSETIGIPLSLEGVYRWIVFLPNKGNAGGALNRYYGLFDTGELKVRGIELRRHDAPQVVKAAQQAMLDELAKASSPEEFTGMIPAALEAMRRKARDVIEGRYALQDMLITRRVSKMLEDYSQLNHQSAALTQLKEAGIQVQPGQRLKFIVCDGGSSDPRRRVRPVELIEGTEHCDPWEYVKLMARAGEALLLPFGYSEERLRRSISI